MKTILSVIAILALALVVESAAGADQRRIVGRQRAASAVTFFSGGASNRVIIQRQFYGAYPHYYQPYYPPVVVISPYAPSYILPPTVVVTSPYFCVLHSQGFVSRVGLLDHLAGTHKIPLDAATSLCPDGGGSCVFPSY
jgi:hypothetical protein